MELIKYFLQEVLIQILISSLLDAKHILVKGGIFA